MAVEIISVGSEYIVRHYRNTGVSVIANRLLEMGIEVDYVSSVMTQESRLEEILRQAIERSALVFVLGGVSSGEYDVTKKLLTRILKKRLVLNYKILDAIKQQYREQGEIMPRKAEKQALVPTDAEIIENPAGNVPGFLFSQEDSLHVILLPGNPQEIEAMLTADIIPRLDPKTFRVGCISGVVLKTCGLSLSKAKDWLRGVERDSQHTVNYVNDGEETSILVTVKGTLQRDVDERLARVESQIRQKLGNYLYGKGGQSLEEIVGAALRAQEKTLAVAESCTGGLISHRLTNIPGSSTYFERGVVVYSNEAKMSILDVSPHLIEEHGAVSAETAMAMAEGVRWLAQTTFGLAVTGIAGPAGGSKDKPVGLVYIALAAENVTTQWRKCQFSGDRLSIKTRTAQTALDMLRHQLLLTHS